MSKAITAKAFDYSLVDKDAKGKLIWLAGAIQKLSVTHATSGLELGQWFADAQEFFRDKKGVFRKWVESETCHCLSSAYNYIKTYEHFGDFPNFGKLELSAMHVLTTNEKAKTKAIKLADKGVAVTHAMAKKLVADEKPKPPPKTKAGSKPKPPPKTPPTDLPEPEPADLGKCPVCAGVKWIDGEDGVVCKKCNQPHGEPGDSDEDLLKTQRAKTVKTAEALIRAFDDLQTMKARPEYDEAILRTKQLVAIARGWK